jgi:acyl-CoA dehydrogenase
VLANHDDGGSLVVRTCAIATDIVSPAAADVDRRARFPKEAIDALRDARVLGALAPIELGGEGASLSQMSEATAALSRACASTGMVFAMHQIQVACLVEHRRTDALTAYLRDEIVAHQALLASATTELGVGGDVRTSRCAIETDGERFTLEKQAPVISYGEYADGVLATARRGPDSPPSDQVLVLCRPPGLTLAPLSEWDTLGFRGTCSRGFTLRAEGPAAEVFPDPYGEISATTMLPVSHVLWSSVWLGMAQAAVSQARAYVRAQARKSPGTTPPAAVKLAQLVALEQQLAALVHDGAARYERSRAGLETNEMDFALTMNGLKVAASTLVLEVATLALGVCGIEGYREDSPYSLGRVLRDAHGASLMVSNDRINTHSAQMLLVLKES